MCDPRVSREGRASVSDFRLQCWTGVPLTLVNFVADKHGCPQDKLQAALAIHRGLDLLYTQVLYEAQKFEYFQQVVGTIIYLHQPLSVGQPGQLLQLHPTCIQLAL
jgi:hypothetical protein